MKISKNSAITIVLPAAATQREQFAAEELQKYIRLICGAQLQIVADDNAYVGQIIAIGGPERNACTRQWISEEAFDREVPGPEGIMIRSFENGLVLAGSSKNSNELERGTVYAVYELLERFCGCSFGAFTKQDIPGGELIPQQNTLRLENLSYVKAHSDVPFRGDVLQYSYQDRSFCPDYELNIAFLDWMCKSRYNYIYTWNGVYEHLKENGMVDACIRRGILFMVGHHDTIEMLLPQQGNAYFPEPYYQTHPEYYRLEADGTRFVDIPNFWGQMTLCARNEDMIRQFSENLNTFLTKNPLVKLYALSVKDGTAPQCCCEKCSPYSKVDNILYFIMRVAEEVGKVHPDVKIVSGVYTDMWEPPAWLKKLPDNILVKEAVWHTSGLRTTGKPDGSCLNGTFYEKNLLKWKALGASVCYYDYFMGVYPGRQRYVPMADEMQAICRRFMEMGIDGAATQMEVYNHWNNITNFYTYGRTAYDTSKTLEDNLELFCRIFGAGSKYIKDNILYAESVLDGQCEIMTAGVWLQRHIDKQRMYDGFEKALAAAETPAARNNVRLMRMAFRYSDIETREDHTNDEIGFRTFKHYDIPERGELLYMKRNFDTFDSYAGYGIMIPVEGEDNGFNPDYWYAFE